MLDKLQKWGYLGLLARTCSATSLSLLRIHYFGRCSSKLVPLVPILFLVGGQLVILIVYVSFVYISRYYRNVDASSFVPHGVGSALSSDFDKLVQV